MKFPGVALLSTLLFTLGALCLIARPMAAGASPASADHGPEPQPGSYCPFPAKGEAAACMIPVQRRYGAFFEAVDRGDVTEMDADRLERDLAGGGVDEGSYLALSSLAYAYYRVAERAAASPTPATALVARLESWNGLLFSAYANSNPESHFREALRLAMADLYHRAPAVPSACEEPGADPASCKTTSRLLETLQQLDDPADEHGVRGALSRLFGRIFGWGD
jgi:hypothetical protein